MKFVVQLVKADTDGNWASQVQGVEFETREAAQEAIEADPTCGPDPYGNTCQVEIVEVDD